MAGAAAGDTVRPVTTRSAEQMYRRTKEFAEVADPYKIALSLRIVRKRDRPTLLTLERWANVMDAIHEAQRGQSQRAAAKDARVQATYAHEAKVVQEAYKSATSGEPEMNYVWYYLAAAEHAGLIV